MSLKGEYGFKFTIIIYVLPEMANNINDCKCILGSYISYKMFHCRMSPFDSLHMSYHQLKERRYINGHLQRPI